MTFNRNMPGKTWVYVIAAFVVMILAGCKMETKTPVPLQQAPVEDVEPKVPSIAIEPPSGPDGTQALIVVQDAKPGDAVRVRFGEQEVVDVVESVGEYQVGAVFEGCDGDVVSVEVQLGEGDLARVLTANFSISGSPCEEVTAEDYYLQGVNAYLDGDYDAALIQLSQALELDPFYDVAYFQRALVYDGLGEVELALADYEIFLMYYTIEDDMSAFARGRIAASKPLEAEVQAYLDRGFSHYENGELDIALINFSEALKINPDVAMAYYGRGLVYDAMGEVDFAIVEYEQFLVLYALVDEFFGYAEERLAVLRGE